MLVGRLLGAVLGAKISAKAMLTTVSFVGLLLTAFAIFLPQSLVNMPVFNGAEGFKLVQVPVNAMLLKDVVKEQIEKGKIVLFSSHQMNYIEEFCDKIAILHRGEIALQGDLRDIKRQYPRDRLVVRSPQSEQILREWGGKAGRTEEGGLLLWLDKPEEKQAVMQQLSARYELDEVKVFEPSLNDIFVEYAGQE